MLCVNPDHLSAPQANKSNWLPLNPFASAWPASLCSNSGEGPGDVNFLPPAHVVLIKKEVISGRPRPLFVRLHLQWKRLLLLSLPQQRSERRHNERIQHNGAAEHQQWLGVGHRKVVSSWFCALLSHSPGYQLTLESCLGHAGAWQGNSAAPAQRCRSILGAFVGFVGSRKHLKN